VRNFHRGGAETRRKALKHGGKEGAEEQVGKGKQRIVEMASSWPSTSICGFNNQMLYLRVYNLSRLAKEGHMPCQILKAN
jgi:hypothetical protein